MDKQEAQKILDAQARRFGQMAFRELVALIKSPAIERVQGETGTVYQIEVQAFWDHPRRPGENLRVLISIDDGGLLSSLFPLSIDFIMAPDGSLVGE
ncbi:MAG: hypothetical protein PVG63_04275 [Anaerolineales bacterium]|jgi:hypothetical protein